ncbi:Hypp1576 [Branchiostoma lanceolatum]|uniref:Hypp1576 protein n=1 Tax=Branchiostoma lanceolatum TaxID=7740 RepID=A0A8K0EPF9_BRALA|nr:Hypp1576 [Branchiostoma lanceolatum]
MSVTFCQPVRIAMRRMTDRRVPTKFDQQQAREQAQADRTSCVLPTCDCQGFLRPTSQSFALLGPRQCATCQHGVTLHRPQTAVDELIVQRVAESGHLKCQTKVGRDEAKKLQVLAEEGGCGNFRAFEPVTIRHLEEEDADQAVEKQRCPCPGFSAGDLQRLLKQYHGLKSRWSWVPDWRPSTDKDPPNLDRAGTQSLGPFSINPGYPRAKWILSAALHASPLPSLPVPLHGRCTSANLRLRRSHTPIPPRTGHNIAATLP